METLKCNICGADMTPIDGQSATKCTCGYTQENISVSDADIVNEIDSLLDLYKTALDGEVWSELENVFPSTLSVDAPDEQDAEPCNEPAQVDYPVVTEEDTVQLNNAPLDKPDAVALLRMTLESIKMNKVLAIVTACVTCSVIVFLIVLNTVLIPNSNRKNDTLSNAGSAAVESGESSNTSGSANLDNSYEKAVSLMDAGKYDEAIASFEALNGYKDSAAKLSECHYNKAVALKESGDTLKALCSFSAAGNYEDAPAQATELRKLYLEARQFETFSAGRNHIVALKADGTVVAAGSNDHHQCDVSDWTDIVAISVGDTHTMGLKSNGTVVHVGAVNYGQRSATEWRDVVTINAGKHYTVGLTPEGTVRSSGLNDYGQRDVLKWQDIAAVSAGDYHTVALKIDGTVVAVGHNANGQCDVSDWTDIVAVYAGDHHTIGLKADGSVVSTGRNAYGQCDISDWQDIIDIGIGTSFTVGLKADGTLVTTGYSYGDLEKVSEWVDIVAISVGASHVAGLKADGTLVTVNFDSQARTDISSWADVKLPE